MTVDHVIRQVALGEDGTRQFKADVRNEESLAAEMAALANADGGVILIGVADDGSIPGLAAEDVKRLNQLISNAASQLVRSPLMVQTEDLALDNGRLFTAAVHRQPVAELELANKDALKVQVKVHSDTGRAPLSEFQRQLLGLIRSNPAVSYGELTALTGKDRSTVMRNVQKLKQQNRLQRVDSRKTGHWTVIQGEE